MVHNNVLQYREHTTYLSIILDNKLSWKEQITEFNKNIVKYTGVFSKPTHTNDLYKDFSVLKIEDRAITAKLGNSKSLQNITIFVA